MKCTELYLSARTFPDWLEKFVFSNFTSFEISPPASDSGVYAHMAKQLEYTGYLDTHGTNTARAQSFFFVPVPLKHVSHAFSPLLAERVHPLCFTVVKGHVGTHPNDVHQWRRWGTQFGHNLQTHQKKTKQHIFQIMSATKKCRFSIFNKKSAARESLCNWSRN